LSRSMLNYYLDYWDGCADGVCSTANGGITVASVRV
jgi:hypothetical protein